MKIAALAGGVGGAKLADGLSKALVDGELSVVVNTADDMNFFGLHISPDLDTVCYTLGGLANPKTGWGQVGETWNVYNTLSKIGAPDWFHLGDHDLALHMERTRLLMSGLSLTEVTKHLCQVLGVKDKVFPMSDQEVRTLVYTKDKRILSFQEYFVKEKCEPEVLKFEFSGMERAFPSEQVISAIEGCDLVVICPSNPWVSIDPILKLGSLREIIKAKKVVAVSPIIAGKTLKGPAAKMYSEMGINPSAEAVTVHYGGILNGFVLDEVDRSDSKKIRDRGIIPFVTNTIMRSNKDRWLLANQIIEFGLSLP